MSSPPIENFLVTVLAGYRAIYVIYAKRDYSNVL